MQCYEFCYQLFLHRPPNLNAFVVFQTSYVAAIFLLSLLLNCHDVLCLCERVVCKENIRYHNVTLS